MKRPPSAAAALLPLFALLLAPPCAAGAEAVRKIALVTIPAELQLKAPPDRIWSFLTTREGFAALTGIRVGEGLTALSAVGDHVEAEMDGDRGHLFVTFVQPGKELRVNFEPDSGGYFCQQRVRLAPWSGGTTLSLADRYTDEKSDADKKAKRVTDQLLDGTRAFQKMVEAP
jgi:uncharacterized protein YndB with AHSA1/START domain